MFTPETFISLVVLGLAVGTFGTLVGAGGGFILTPVLLILYPADSAATITAISLMVVFWNAASGSAAYAWQRRIDYRTGVIFALCTLPGSVVGAVLVQYASRRLFDALTAALLGGLAVWILARGNATDVVRTTIGGAHRVLVDRSGARYEYQVPLLRGGLLSLGVGFVATFLGIGGGIIHVPLLIGVLGFPVHVATATSHFILAIMSGTSTLTHVALGSFAAGHGLRRAASLSLGVVVGAQLGAAISQKVGGPRIRQLLAGGLAVLAVRLAWSVVIT